MELDLEEALGYLGVGSQPPEPLRQQVQAVADELTAILTPRFLYRVFPLNRTVNGVELKGSGVVLTGNSAKTMLADCHHAALLCCTLGTEFDTLIRAAQVRDMAYAAVLDACGSAWVEAGCDWAEEEVTVRLPDWYRTDRFSPGYGDLPLSVQPGICQALDTGRRLGVWVTDACLLNPIKSVTAVMGLSNHPQSARIRGCAHCAIRERCTMRKEGNRCGL